MGPERREYWGSRFGFIMAAVGSAVGLGNMWRFPYYTAENGGAAFVILYLLMTVLVGVPIMLAEMTAGRGSQKSPIEAMRHYEGESRKFPHPRSPEGIRALATWRGVSVGLEAAEAFELVRSVTD